MTGDLIGTAKRGCENTVLGNYCCPIKLGETSARGDGE